LQNNEPLGKTYFVDSIALKVSRNFGPHTGEFIPTRMPDKCNAGDPWLATECLHFANAATQYSVDLYRAVMTIATVGYGDILPNTNIDKSFIMMAMFFSGILQMST
jgi:hypothetical protein